jgi:hypothetical protein
MSALRRRQARRHARRQSRPPALNRAAAVHRVIPMSRQRHSIIRLCLAVTLAAVSCSTVPVPPPLPEVRAEEKPAVQEAISWTVSPAEGYVDEYGFVTLDFTPPGRADSADVPDRAPPGRADSADVPDRAPPGRAEGDGGRLTVHLGRRSMAHANSAWYSIRVQEGGDVLLDFTGKEGIPNVKGPDGNWWNDVLIDLAAPFTREIIVTVMDARTGASYRFTVRRVVSRSSTPAG